MSDQRLDIELRADPSKLKGDLDAAGGHLDQFKGKVDSLGGAADKAIDKIGDWSKTLFAGGVGGLAGGLVAGPLGQAAIGAVTYYMGDFAKSLITVRAEAKDTELTLLGMRDTMWSLQKGSGKSESLFSSLGLDPDKQRLKGADETMEDVATRIAMMTNATERAAAATAVWGDQAKELLATLAKGPEAVDDVLEKIEELNKDKRKAFEESHVAYDPRHGITDGGDGYTHNAWVMQHLAKETKTQEQRRKEETFTEYEWGRRNVFGESESQMRQRRVREARAQGTDRETNLNFDAAMKAMEATMQGFLTPLEQLHAQADKAGWNDKQKDRAFEKWEETEKKRLDFNVKKAGESLQSEYDSITMTADERRRWELKKKGASDKDLESFDLQVGLNQGARANEGKKRVEEGLQFQIDTFGKSAREVELWRLAVGDARKGIAPLGDEALKVAKALGNQLDVLNLQKSVESPLEVFRKEMDRMDRLAGLDDKTRALATVKGIDALERQLGGKRDYTPIGALKEGSAEAMSAIFRAQGTPQETAQARLERLATLANEQRSEALRQGAEMVAALKQFPNLLVLE